MKPRKQMKTNNRKSLVECYSGKRDTFYEWKNHFFFLDAKVNQLNASEINDNIISLKFLSIKYTFLDGT